VQAAASIQQQVSKTNWPAGAIVKIRIGIHTGYAVWSEQGFTGTEVSRTSRISHAANGGQVIVSASIFEEISGHIHEKLTLRSRGTYILKDFDEPQELFQLEIHGLQSDLSLLRATESVPVIAVLPFRHLYNSNGEADLGEGISEEIIIALARFPGLRVVARSSSFSFKGKSHNVSMIGAQLGASVVLEGSLRIIGKHLRINVELVNVETGFNQWSNRYDRKMEDVFSLVDEIAQNVANALDVELKPERLRKTLQTQTAVVEAYEFYLKGRRFYYQYSQQCVQYAMEMFRKAIEIDPDYALAYCGLADCYSYLYMYQEDSKKNLKGAEEASKKAIDLKPDLPEAYASRGVVLALSKNIKDAEISFEKALLLDRRLFDVYYLYGRFAFANGELAKSARLFEKANKVRPEDFQSILLAAQSLDDLGHPDRAEGARIKGITIAEQQLKLNPADVRALYLTANALIHLNKKKQAMQYLQRAITLEPGDPMLLYNAGCIYSVAGMKDLALDCLESSLEAGLKQGGWYENDPDLDPLHEDPRFQALLKKTI